MDASEYFPPNSGNLYLDKHLLCIKEETNNDNSWSWAWIARDGATNEQIDEHKARAAAYAQIDLKQIQRNETAGQESSEENDNAASTSNAVDKEEDFESNDYSEPKMVAKKQAVGSKRKQQLKRTQLYKMPKKDSDSEFEYYNSKMDFSTDKEEEVESVFVHNDPKELKEPKAKPFNHNGALAKAKQQRKDSKNQNSSAKSTSNSTTQSCKQVMSSTNAAIQKAQEQARVKSSTSPKLAPHPAPEVPCVDLSALLAFELTNY
jgi:hypothetical protein